MMLDLTRELFDGLFPPKVVVVSRDPRNALPPGHAAEEAQIVRAVTKRQNEFRAGRACAHDALGSLGVQHTPLLAGPDREPIWPDGIVGSISHSNHLCVAAVARATDLRGIGVDTELDELMPEALIPKVCTAREASRGLHRQVFSAKETTYKCLHPIVKKFFGFHAAEVELSAVSFEVTLLVDLPPFSKGARFEGKHRTLHGHIVTALAI